MTGIVANAAEQLIDSVLHSVLQFMGHIAKWIGMIGIMEAQLPWVQTLYHTLYAVAGGIFAVYLAYTLLTRWILWNEGTADYDGTLIMKGILRVILYMGVSGSLALVVYRFGLDLGWVITANSLKAGVHALNGFWPNVKASVGGNLVEEFGQFVLGIVALVVAVLALIWIFFETLERGVQLTVYYLAAPFMALGQLNADGGVWSTWWRKLVILSLSQAIQLLCVEGLAGTPQVLLWMQHSLPPSPGGAMAGALGFVLGLLIDIVWLVVGIRGPHLLEEFSMRSGVGAIGGWAGSQAANRAASAIGPKPGSPSSPGK